MILYTREMTHKILGTASQADYQLGAILGADCDIGYDTCASHPLASNRTGACVVGVDPSRSALRDSLIIFRRCY